MLKIQTRAVQHYISVARCAKCFFGASTIFGSIISSTYLSQFEAVYATEMSTDFIEANSGINDCLWLVDSAFNNTNFEKPPSVIIWTLVGIYSLFSVLSILLCIFFLDQLYDLVPLAENKGGICNGVIEVALSGFVIMKHRKILLLAPLSGYSAVISTFFYGDFFSSWVTCSLGVSWIGYVSLPQNFLIPLVAYGAGVFAKYFGNIIPSAFSFTIMSINIIVLFFWPINKDSIWVFFVICIAFSMPDPIITVITQSLYGSVAPDNTAASFGNYNFVWCVFAAICYGYSYYLCSKAKLWIVVGVTVITIISFAVLEWDLWKERKKSEQITISKEQEVGVSENAEPINISKQQEWSASENSEIKL
jgi:hypothetical protein